MSGTFSMRSLKALLAVAIFGALVYVAYQVVPVYMSSYQFQDAVEEEARLDSYSQKTEQDIRDTVLKKAQSLDIPLTADQIRVHKTVHCRDNQRTLHGACRSAGTSLRFVVHPKLRESQRLLAVGGSSRDLLRTGATFLVPLALQ